MLTSLVNLVPEETSTLIDFRNFPQMCCAGL